MSRAKNDDKTLSAEELDRLYDDLHLELGEIADLYFEARQACQSERADGLWNYSQVLRNRFWATLQGQRNLSVAMQEFMARLPVTPK